MSDDDRDDVGVMVVRVPCDDAPDDFVHQDTCRNHPSRKGGPSLVNSEAYRDGWTNIFGNRERGQA